jgi:hypothetical protein
MEGLMSLNKKEEYMIIVNAISILTTVCSASPIKVTDMLTGYLWDEEEASDIKELQHVKKY